jgi:hypothetical protein
MKINKYISVFLAILILVSNIGMVFKVHYCRETIASISLESDFQTSSSEENCCGIFEKKASCCTDKVFHFQKKSENVFFDTFSFFPDFIFTFEIGKPFVFSKNLVFRSVSTSSYYCDVHAPPLFKLYHQFIFYA